MIDVKESYTSKYVLLYAERDMSARVPYTRLTNR